MVRSELFSVAQVSYAAHVPLSCLHSFYRLTIYIYICIARSRLKRYIYFVLYTRLSIILLNICTSYIFTFFKLISTSNRFIFSIWLRLWVTIFSTEYFELLYFISHTSIWSLNSLWGYIQVNVKHKMFPFNKLLL